MILNNVENCAKIGFPEVNLEIPETEPYLSTRRKKARERAINKGFTDEYHMEGFYYFNRLDSEQYSGYDVDVLHMTSGENFE